MDTTSIRETLREVGLEGEALGTLAWALAAAVIVWWVVSYASLQREIRKIRDELDRLAGEGNEAGEERAAPDRFVAPTVAADAPPVEGTNPEAEVVDYVFGDPEPKPAAEPPPRPAPERASSPPEPREPSLPKFDSRSFDLDEEKLSEILQPLAVDDSASDDDAPTLVKSFDPKKKPR